MQHQSNTTTAADRALQRLPQDLADEASALAWHLFQEQGMDLGQATIEAVSTVADLLGYASEWDRDADELLLLAHCPCLSDCPTPALCAGQPACPQAFQKAA